MSDFGQLQERVRQLEATLPPENVDVPYISGDGVVGATLTCTTGNWNCMSNGSYAYAWSGGGAATGATYVVAAGDAGTSITCTVTATNANGSLAAPPSNAIAIAAAGGMAMAEAPARSISRETPPDPSKPNATRGR